jgi:hypothetical protein
VIDIPGNSNLVHYLYVARERIVVPITTLTGKNTVRIIASISILVGKELIGVIKDPLGHRDENTNANEIRSRDESSTTTDESNYNTKNHTIENRKSKREVANGVRSSADAHHHDSLRAFRSVDV